MAQRFSKSFYASKEWKMTREYILKRDNYLCVKCGSPAEEVHHIIHLNPNNIGDVKITMNPDNLMSLCKDCHFKEHYKDKAEGHRMDKFKDDNVAMYEFDENGMPISPPV